MGLKKTKLAQVHPCDVLADLLGESGLTSNAPAMALRVPANRIGAILKGQRGITGDTALRLGRYFWTSAAMWMNLHSKWELAVAENELRERIDREVLPRAAA
jgi:addiction module HigA family antidote